MRGFAAGIAVIVLLTALALPAASRTPPPDLTSEVTDAGPLMVQPWGTPPPGSNFDKQWTSNRDCGLSTGLSNGRRFWVFCDGSLFDQFHIYRSNSASNSAAIASVHDPLVMRDTLAGGAYVQFVPPQLFYPCSGFRATWPTAVATLPDDDGRADTDRIVVFFQNNCVNGTGPDDWTMRHYDIGVAEYRYDARLQPSPIKATVLNARLFPAVDGDNYQFGGVVAADGGATFLHLYSCIDQTTCHIRRVRVSNDAATDRAHVANAAWWNVWTGPGWTNQVSQAAPILDGGGEAAVSAQSLTVAYVPAIGRYVMTYTPWPVFHHKVAIRTATRPEGPWSPAQLAELPGCQNSLHCYAAVIQPHLSGPNELAISYLHWNDFNGKVATLPWRKYGRLRIIKVPFVAPTIAATTHNNVPVVAEVQNGSLALAFLWQGVWQKWFPLGAMRRFKGTPALVTNGAGRLTLFATGEEGSIWRIEQQPDGTFSEPLAILSSRDSDGDLAAALGTDGRVRLFSVDHDGRVFQAIETAPGSAVWPARAELYPGSAFEARRGLSAAVNADGRIELFAVGGWGKLFHAWQVDSTGDGRWSGFGFWPLYYFGTQRTPFGVSVARRADGRLDVFAVEDSGRVVHAWQQSINGSTDWAVGELAGVTTSGPYRGVAAAAGASGVVHVVTIAPDRLSELTAASLSPTDPLTFSPLAPL